MIAQPSGQVKVTDFGIAKAVGGDSELTQVGTVMGTATYFSPEQAQGKRPTPERPLLARRRPLRDDGRSARSPARPGRHRLPARAGAAPPPRSLNSAIPVALEAITSSCWPRTRSRLPVGRGTCAPTCAASARGAQLPQAAPARHRGGGPIPVYADQARFPVDEVPDPPKRTASSCSS